MAELLRMSQDNPREALSIMDKMEPVELDLMVLARFLAYTSAALDPFIAAQVPYWSEPGELMKASEGDTISLCESALEEIVRIESGTVQSYFVEPTVFEEEDNRARANAISCILESLRPGRVQEIRGKTTFRYFGPARFGRKDGINFADSLGQDAMESLLDVYFSAPATIRSVIVTEVLEKRNGSKMIKCRVFEKATKSRPTEDPSPCVGILTLGQDGSYFFEDPS